METVLLIDILEDLPSFFTIYKKESHIDYLEEVNQANISLVVLDFENWIK